MLLVLCILRPWAAQARRCPSQDIGSVRRPPQLHMVVEASAGSSIIDRRFTHRLSVEQIGHVVGRRQVGAAEPRSVVDAGGGDWGPADDRRLLRVLATE
jgi:hypothetical protein